MVIRRNVPNPVGVSVYRDDIFWVDKNLNGIFQSQKYANQNSTKPTLIRSNLANLRDVQIFDVNVQPEPQQNPCKEPICEQLCFALPTSELDFKCDCASGKQQGSKCVDLEEYIVFATRSEIRSVHIDPKHNEVPFQPIVSYVFSLQKYAIAKSKHAACFNLLHSFSCYFLF